MEKTIIIGTMDMTETGFKKPLTVEINIELTPKNDNYVLSISGVIWISSPRKAYAWGQIKDEVKNALKENRFSPLNISKDDAVTLLQIWDNHHLNDLIPYCPHQKQYVQRYKKVYGEHFFKADNYQTIIKLPELNKCPVCGYRYGTRWFFEPLPNEVLKFIENLPDRKEV